MTQFHLLIQEFLPVAILLINYYNNCFILFFSDVDDEGIERDSDDVEDYKSRHTKDLDYILDVSNLFIKRIFKFEIKSFRWYLSHYALGIFSFV